MLGMDIKETYNRIAEDWHKDHLSDDWWQEGTNMFISYLKTGDTVLDVGCGSGVKAKYLSNSGLKVTGIDISDKMIEIAKREAPKSMFYALAMESLDDLDETFNGVLSQASLLHTHKKDAGEIFAKMVRKLKPEGYLYVAVKEKWPDGPEEEVRHEHDYGYDYERFFSYYTMDEIKKFFTDAGLHIVYDTVKHSGKTNWIQVIGKK